MSTRIGAIVNEDGEAVISNTAENWELLKKAFGESWFVGEETTEEMTVFVEDHADIQVLVDYINEHSSNP